MSTFAMPRYCEKCSVAVGARMRYCDDCHAPIKRETWRRSRAKNAELWKASARVRYRMDMEAKCRALGRQTDAAMDERARAMVEPQKDRLYLVWEDLRRIQRVMGGPEAFVPLDLLMHFESRGGI